MYIEDDKDLDVLLASATAADAPPQLERIYEGVPSRGASFELLNRFQRDSRYLKLGFRAGQWFEVSEDIYWYFLEVLPPLHMSGGGFVMSECTMADLYESFFEINGRFYCAVLHWNGPASFRALHKALRAEVAQ